MQIPFGDLKRQHVQLRPELDAAIARVLESGWYILGPETQAFEAAFAAYCGTRYAIGVGNGTEALSLAMAALGLQPGDEIITVANASVYETLTALQLGVKPVFVDIDPRSYTINPALIEAAITPRTRAIIPVHLYGRMAEMAPIMALAEQYGLAVIEDCAQAHGATYRGQVAGSVGVIGCFSFYPTKNLGAIGDGGMLTTNDDQIAMKLRRLREYGWSSKYFTSEPHGLNSRLDELQSAILAVKLQYLPTWNQRRREIAGLYRQLLADLPIQLPEESPDGEHVYHLYVIQSDQRDQVAAGLRQRGIGSAVHYPIATHLQPIYQDLAPAGSLPISEHMSQRILSLPNYPELHNAEVEAVALALREVCAMF